MIEEIFTYLTGKYTLPNAAALCVLPVPPKQKQRTPEQKPRTGMYVIDEEKNEFGWDDEASIRRDNGAVNYLTSGDIDALKERDLWTVNEKTKKGRAVIEKNRRAKKAWFDGKTKAECVALLNVSESWIEKRGAAFSAALSDEIGEKT